MAVTLFVLETVVGRTHTVQRVRLHGLVAMQEVLLAQPMTTTVQAAVAVAQVESEETVTTLAVPMVATAELVVICLHGVVNLLELPTTVVAVVGQPQVVLVLLVLVVLAVVATVRRTVEAVRLVLQTQVVEVAELDKSAEHWLV